MNQLWTLVFIILCCYARIVATGIPCVDDRECVIYSYSYLYCVGGECEKCSNDTHCDGDGDGPYCCDDKCEACCLSHHCGVLDNCDTITKECEFIDHSLYV